MVRRLSFYDVERATTMPPEPTEATEYVATHKQTMKDCHIRILAPNSDIGSPDWDLFEINDVEVKVVVKEYRNTETQHARMIENELSINWTGEHGRNPMSVIQTNDAQELELGWKETKKSRVGIRVIRLKS